MRPAAGTTEILSFAKEANPDKICRSACAREVAMDRNRVLLIGGAIVLVLFLAYLLKGGGGVLPQ